jgi:hypothetical protein
VICQDGFHRYFPYTPMRFPPYVRARAFIRIVFVIFYYYYLFIYFFDRGNEIWRLCEIRCWMIGPHQQLPAIYTYVLFKRGIYRRTLCRTHPRAVLHHPVDGETVIPYRSWHRFRSNETRVIHTEVSAEGLQTRLVSHVHVHARVYIVCQTIGIYPIFFFFCVFYALLSNYRAQYVYV